MKAVMLSLRPQWCEKIFNGEKTIEVRKSRPYIPTPFTVYVYQTKHKGGNATVREVLNSVYGGGKVIGSFVCDRITCCQAYYGESGEKHLTNLFGCDVKNTCLTEHEMFDYIIGKDKKEGTGWLWHIAEQKLFDKPRGLGEFWAYNAEIHERFANEEDFCCYNGTNEYGELLNECAIFNTDIKRCYSCWEEWSGWCHRIKRPPQSWCYVEEEE